MPGCSPPAIVLAGVAVALLAYVAFVLSFNQL